MKEEEMEQLIDPNEVGQGKKSKLLTVGTIVVWILLLFFVFQVVTGYLNLHRVYNGEKPYFLISEEQKDYKDISMKVYRFGLYKIIFTEDEKQTSASIKVFFYDEEKLVK